MKEGHVYAFRAVLVSFSPYFYSSLYGEFEDSVVNKTSLVGSIDLSSFKSDHVELMVSYMYNGETHVPVDIKQAVEFFRLINFCQVERLQTILSNCFIKHFLNNFPLCVMQLA